MTITTMVISRDPGTHQSLVSCVPELLPGMKGGSIDVHAVTLSKQGSHVYTSMQW
jgi:hypothetical protein